MADSRPVRHTGRSGGDMAFYGPEPETEQPGLKPVPLRQPKNPTVMERKACECGESFILTDVEPEVTCGCGKVVKLS